MMLANARHLLLLFTSSFLHTASAVQYPVTPTVISTKQTTFMQGISLKQLDETAVLARGIVYQDRSEIFVIEIPMPAWLVKAKTEFSADPDAIYAYGEGKKAPCDKEETRDAARNITFIPVIMEIDTTKKTTTSESNVQSYFKCTYDTKQPFIRCEDRIHSTLLSRSIEFTAVLAMVPDCKSAKAFTDALREGNKTENAMFAVIGVVAGMMVFGCFFIFCYIKQDDDHHDGHHPTQQYPTKGTPRVEASPGKPVTPATQNKEAASQNQTVPATPASAPPASRIPAASIPMLTVADLGSFFSTQRDRSSYAKVPTTMQPKYL